MAKLDKEPVEEVDEVAAKKARKAAKRAAAEAAAAEEVEAETDPVAAKKARKAAKRAAAEAAVAAEVEVEIDPAAAKKARKAAKLAAVAAVADAEQVVAQIEPTEDKKAKKAANKSAEAAPVEQEEVEVDPAEEKKKRKAAKRAAAEALAKADAGDGEVNEAVEETPKKKKKDIDIVAETPPAASEKISEADPNPFRLFVGGLAWTVTEEQLSKDFVESGEVADLKLLMDRETGQSRGIAFVTMATKAGFDAMLKRDGDEYAGRAINVSKANSDGGKGKGKGKGKDGKDGKGKGKGKHKGPSPKPAGCTSVVVKGLAYAVTEEDLRKVFAKCGPGPANVKLLTDRETGESRGLAFIDFDDEGAVDEAMKLTETALKGRSFFMDYSVPRL